MFSIDLECPQGAKELRIAELWECGCTGIVELDDTSEAARMRAFFDDDKLVLELQSRFGGEAQPADTRDWVAFAREHLQPMEIGHRIFVVPEWRNEATPAGRIRIEVNAGLAFGTGAHETTRLCLESIERHLQPGASVVDVGTGSGILSEAALKLGASKARACDTDHGAVIVARENFRRAGLDVPVFVGSADSIASASADIVVANISPAWIAELATEWIRILKPGGVAILSGFEAADIPVIGAAIQKAGGRIADTFGDSEWRMIEVTG
ncbi:MAG TPA: 50S ribosomal protein L11 methyltransferase [Bryobacteraceae bacterium]|nr:50S ribosomal protein L11 methyltransferase [Bryobacteraceae bacterium]